MVRERKEESILFLLIFPSLLVHLLFENVVFIRPTSFSFSQASLSLLLKANSCDFPTKQCIVGTQCFWTSCCGSARRSFPSKFPQRKLAMWPWERRRGSKWRLILRHLTAVFRGCRLNFRTRWLTAVPVRFYAGCFSRCCSVRSVVDLIQYLVQKKFKRLKSTSMLSNLCARIGEMTDLNLMG